MKKCSKCKELKPLTEFYKHKTNKDGFCGICKKCHLEYCKKWQENNPDKVKEKNKRWRENNLEKYREQKKTWYKNNLEKVRKATKEWQKNNPEKCREYQRKYYKSNPEKIKEKSKEYYKNNSEKSIEYARIWQKNNHKKMKDYWARKRAIPKNKINASFRENLRQSLKGKKNGRKWETLVGYTLEELMQRLENQFEHWMNWENYGAYEEGKLKWNIDHIKPQSLFNFTSPEDPEFKECWALENLQPMEVVANIKKSNRYK